jgi:hypothetical protein
MRTAGTLTLHIEPASGAMPARVAILLANVGADDQRHVRLTPDCMTLDELEGQINALQDELDLLRADARRAFELSATMSPSHERPFSARKQPASSRA